MKKSTLGVSTPKTSQDLACPVCRKPMAKGEMLGADAVLLWSGEGNFLQRISRVISRHKLLPMFKGKTQAARCEHCKLCLFEYTSA